MMPASEIAKGLSNSEITENDYNLSVSTYVEEEDTRKKPINFI